MVQILRSLILAAFALTPVISAPVVSQDAFGAIVERASSKPSAAADSSIGDDLVLEERGCGSSNLGTKAAHCVMGVKIVQHAVSTELDNYMDKPKGKGKGKK